MSDSFDHGTAPLLSAFRRRRWSESTSALIWILAAAATSSLLLRFAPPSGTLTTVLGAILVLVLLMLATAMVRLGVALLFPPPSAAREGARIIDREARLDDLLLTAVSLSPQAEDKFGWHHLIRKRAARALSRVDLRRLVPVAVPWALWATLALLIAVWMMPRFTLLPTSSSGTSAGRGALPSQQGGEAGAMAIADVDDSVPRSPRESSRRMITRDPLQLTELYLPQIEPGDADISLAEALQPLAPIKSRSPGGDEGDEGASSSVDVSLDPVPEILASPSESSPGSGFRELERRLSDPQQVGDARDAESRSSTQENDHQASPSGKSAAGENGEQRATTRQAAVATDQVAPDGAAPGGPGGSDPGAPSNAETSLSGDPTAKLLVTLEQALLRQLEEQPSPAKERRWRSSREQRSELDLVLARRSEWLGIDSNIEPFRVEPRQYSLYLSYFAPTGPGEEVVEP